MLQGTGDDEPVKPQLIFEVAKSHQDAERFYGKKDSLDLQYENFDPNTVTLTQLKVMGVDHALAQRLINYRKAGGKFNEERDILKVYGFPEDLFRKLEPYIVIPKISAVLQSDKQKATSDDSIAKPHRKSEEKFDLNTASQEELASIYGIGQVLSSRIIKFRESLGGFIRQDQVYEVYGLDSAVAANLIRACFIASGFAPQKIQINSVSESELASHPYCSKNAAEILVNYRINHGGYKGVEDIRDSRAFREQELAKILPYLSF